MSYGFEIFGSLQSQYLQYAEEIEGRDASRPLFRLSLENKGKLNQYFNYKLQPDFYFDPQSVVDQQKTLFDTKESYIEFVKNIFSLRLGWLQANWGVTEGFDPAGVMQSYRLWNPLSPQSLASPSMHALWGWSSSQFEVFFVFERRKSQLPQANSRWLPDRFIDTEVEVDNSVFVLPSDPRYSYVSYDEVDRARSWNFGLRYYKNLGGLDLSLFFFEGAAPMPLTQIGLTVDSVGTIDGKDAFFLNQNIRLTPVDYRQKTLGATLVYGLGRSIFRYSGHYQDEIGDLLAVPNWQQANVLGWELGVLPSGDLTMLLEYSKIKRAGQLNSTASSISRIFDDAYLLGLRYQFNDNWNVLGTFLYDSVFGDQVHSLTLNGKLLDSLSLQLAAVSIQENDISTALAGYTKNDQVSVQLEYFF